MISEKLKRRLMYGGILAFIIALILSRFPIWEHNMVGKFGCVPKALLFLTDKEEFESFEDIIDGNKFYYIQFQKVITHTKDANGHDDTIEFRNAFFRSTDPLIAKIWNDTMNEIRPCFLSSFGVGVCDVLPHDSLFLDSKGRRYFTTEAFFCGKRQRYPANDRDCERK